MTPRQREILELMLRDLSDKMIADVLEISVHTVKAQKNLTYKTLSVHTGPGAIGKYLQIAS